MTNLTQSTVDAIMRVIESMGVILGSLRRGPGTVSTVLGAAVTIGIMDDEEGRIAIDGLVQTGQITRTGEGDGAWLQLAPGPGPGPSPDAAAAPYRGPIVLPPIGDADPARIPAAMDAVADAIADMGDGADGPPDKPRLYDYLAAGETVSAPDADYAIERMIAERLLVRDGAGWRLSWSGHRRPWQHAQVVDIRVPWRPTADQGGEDAAGGQARG